VFPHKTEKASFDKAYKELRYSPYGNTLTVDFAKAVIENEGMGKDDITDVLAVSFSSPDYIGHKFGVNSVEVEDTYLRLDIELGKFLDYLDNKIGKGQYLVFVSSDHGAASAPGFMTDHKIPAGEFMLKLVREEPGQKIDSLFGIKQAILYTNNSQVYLNKKAINASPRAGEIYDYILNYYKNLNFIQDAFYLQDMYKANLPQTIRTMLQNGYNANRSGDLQFVLKPGWIEDGNHASTHGFWNPNDAHIPLLWYGWNIKPGKTNRETYMTDIAATLAALLHIQMPNGCIGKVIEEVVK
jgi:arylsulfatase A-like enzyme